MSQSTSRIAGEVQKRMHVFLVAENLTMSKIENHIEVSSCKKREQTNERVRSLNHTESISPDDRFDF